MLFDPQSTHQVLHEHESGVGSVWRADSFYLGFNAVKVVFAKL